MNRISLLSIIFIALVLTACGDNKQNKSALYADKHIVVDSKPMSKAKNQLEADKVFSTIFDGIEKDAIDALVLFIKNGGDVNTTESPYKENSPETHKTLLHEAAARPSPEAVKILLANGANIDAIDVDGNTPLHEAIYWETEIHYDSSGKSGFDATKLLIQSGADTSAKNNDGLSPKAYAIEMQKPEKPTLRIINKIFAK